MTGRVTYSPEARQHLNALDDWITEKASADAAQRFVSAILDAVDASSYFHTLAEHATTSGRA